MWLTTFIIRFIISHHQQQRQCLENELALLSEYCLVSERLVYLVDSPLWLQYVLKPLKHYMCVAITQTTIAIYTLTYRYIKLQCNIS